MLRPLTLILLVLLAPPGCDEAAQAPPELELYIDGTLAGPSPAIDFPDTPTEGQGIAAEIEIKNLGPATLVLTGTPPVLLERDDRLAFRVTQPPKTRFERGESLVINVVFSPHSPGSSAARLSIATRGSVEPLTVSLTGDGVQGSQPELFVTIDGAPIGASFDYGAVPALDRKEANVRLANGGTGTLQLGSVPLAVGGADASAFELGQLPATSVGEGAHVDVPLAFVPSGCRSYRATLTIDYPDARGSDDVELTGRGGENPQGHSAVTDTELLDAPDLDVTLSAPSVGGKRRFAVGNLTVGSFSGQVGVFAWDGCTLSAAKTISAASAGISAELFGAQVALSDDGTTLLVTARDQTKNAWLFAIGGDDEPRFLATLATFDEGAGHGRGAGLAGDGSVAFIGQELADSGFNSHGAVFAYERPAAGWQNAPEANFRLGPSAPTQVELIGSWVETSVSGDVIASAALLTPVGAGSKGPATAFVWQASRDPETDARTWGKEIPLGEPNHRTETVRLTSAQVPSDSAARVAVSADGNTIALSAVVNSEVQLRIYTRSSSVDLWGKPTSSIDERLPTATIALSASAALRMALGPAGTFLVIADKGGAREIARPASGWLDESGFTNFAATWNVPFYGRLAVSPDGVAFAGMDEAGSAWFVFR